MSEENEEPQDLKDKLVIDTAGTIVGKCIGVKEDETGDTDPVLIVEVETEENGMIETNIPITTIQAVGETIVLSVEIEGLIKDKTIKPMDPEAEQEQQTSEEEDEDTSEGQEESKKSEEWTIYKSIRA